MSDEEWIRAAMSDDSVVVEALLCLHRSEPLPPKTGGASTLKLEWSVRQRRSKTLPQRKKGDKTRASPTTPLSWSGATSISGGGIPAADGVEESSVAVKPSETVRSKISVTSGATPFKRSRRKKTLAELKEEESLLLKERKSLKSELASIRLLVEKQRARSHILKKMKADSQTSLYCKPASAPNATASSPHGLSRGEELGGQVSSFLLPDLNIPLDNNSNPEILY